MTLTLTEDYIKKYVRDEKTWQRALSQGNGDVMIPYSQIRQEVTRRGSAENRCTALFSGYLREDVDTRRKTKKWCTDPRTSEPTDCLKLLLRSNLRKKGYLESNQSAMQQRATKEVKRSERTRQYFEQQLENVMLEEEWSRKSLKSSERGARKELGNLKFLSTVTILLDLEYAERRDIFREWINEMFEFQQLEEEDFALTSGVEKNTFKKIRSLVASERSQRLAIEGQEKKDAVSLGKYALLFQLKAIECEIERCKGKERLLLRKKIEKV
ncbi:hypothetical protein ADEAN_000277400 [Angomonas deanei]|uniref:Uncharacterized protein n=1 Tax=Angomonas deanei TaxID=59799 RepID=A0A7G2C6U8_9TRYP|nr:hypothetical protein ADEAN_000277400 [Angomonas deanei]